jgi:thiamine pyrophosphokinase
LQRIVIFANGELPDINRTLTILKDDDYIICADGGTRHVSALDLKPDLVIGDLDSADRFLLEKLRKEGVDIELFPRDKDETDLELAINHAIGLAPPAIMIMAALGGRLDQTLANIALLSDERLSGVDIRLDDGVQEILFCRDRVQIQGRSGDILSLLPWGALVQGVRTQGLRWALAGETLYPERTRGISNEMLSDTASIEIGSGLLMVVHQRKD